MDEKITIQNLIDILINNTSINKEYAEHFVKEFFQLIEETLEKEKYVKIKGFGTFKLIDVESRESIDVNSGERFLIKEHKKITFIPDTSLRDLINQPFAHFETVPLRDDLDLSNIDTDDGKAKVEEENEEDEDVDADMVDSEESVATEKEDAKDNMDEKRGEDEGKEFVNIEKNNLISTPNAKSELESDEKIDLESVNKLKDKSNAITEEVVEQGIEKKQENIIGSEENAERKTEEEIDANEQKKSEVPKTLTDTKKQLTAEEIIANELKKSNNLYPANRHTHKTTKVTHSYFPIKILKYKIVVAILSVLLLLSIFIPLFFPDFLMSAYVSLNINQKFVQERKGGPNVPNIIVKSDTALVNAIRKAENTIAINALLHADSLQQDSLLRIKNEQTIEDKNLMPSFKPQNLVKADSTLYKIVGIEDEYILKDGETLTSVSLRYYGTKWLWPYIVKSNSDIIKRPNLVYGGMKLKIPKLVRKVIK
ncbi:MAG: HU family DNA-binding protein [Bacteroidaceae bacterium]